MHVANAFEATIISLDTRTHTIDKAVHRTVTKMLILFVVLGVFVCVLFFYISIPRIATGEKKMRLIFVATTAATKAISTATI